MPGGALPPRHAGLDALAQHLSAFGAHGVDLLARGGSGSDRPRGARRRILSVDHCRDRARDQPRWHDRIDGHVGDRARRHAGVHRLLRILDDRRAAARLDHRQTGRPVVAGPG